MRLGDLSSVTVRAIRIRRFQRCRRDAAGNQDDPSAQDEKLCIQHSFNTTQLCRKVERSLQAHKRAWVPSSSQKRMPWYAIGLVQVGTIEILEPNGEIVCPCVCVRVCVHDFSSNYDVMFPIMLHRNYVSLVDAIPTDSVLSTCFQAVPRRRPRNAWLLKSARCEPCRVVWLAPAFQSGQSECVWQIRGSQGASHIFPFSTSMPEIRWNKCRRFQTQICSVFVGAASLIVATFALSAACSSGQVSGSWSGISALSATD